MNLYKYSKALLLLILPLLITGCDKDDNPLPSGYKIEILKGNVKFIDEVPMILPPGAKDGPEMRYTHSQPGYQTKESLSLISRLYKEGNPKNDEFSIFLYYPMQGGIELNKKYSIEPIPGKEIVIEGEGDFNEFESGQPFFKYNTDYDKSYYGTGSIIFIKYEENEKGVMVAEGSIDFSVPSENGDDTVMKGTFKLPVYIDY